MRDFKGKKKRSSPSRTYVVICNKADFSGHYMRKFVLPMEDRRIPEHKIVNNSAFACWYFMSWIDWIACVQDILTFEDYSDIKEVK
jgi:hypothetical protein